MGLLEPINTRITDPQYFLDTPQQGRTCSPVPPPGPFDSWVPPGAHSPLPGLSPSGSHLTEGRKTQPPAADGKWNKGSAAQEACVLRVGPQGVIQYSLPRTCSTGRSWMGT